MISANAPGVPTSRSVVGAIAAAFLLAACQAPEPPASTHELSGPTMGTSWVVKVVAKDLPPEQLQAIESEVGETLERLNSRMSHYLEDSELSRLNRWREADPFPLSAETLEVLQHAKEINAATGGAFDITVGPLVNAWGFGPPGRPTKPPAEHEIERLLALTGSELIEIDRASSAVSKRLPELSLDLSAIAKGYAVDQVADALDARRIDNYMVEVGGEVRTRGRNTQGEAWQIGIERPIPGERAIDLIVPLSDLAMATSGDYRNYYEEGGRRISHTIDPRTGYPITHNVASVSVVAPLCVRADAYATGLLVLGPQGFDLAEQLGLAAYFLQRDKEGLFVGRMTSAFKQLLNGERG